ncbi:MAG: phage terminase large subunit [Clostridiales bacterium]|nr:phage terminase large subunit [Clostridiales bacterium]
MNITVTMNPIYKKHLNNKQSTQIFFGGSSSGKSFFIAQKIVIDCLNGVNWLCCRNVAGTIRSSVFNQIVKTISDMSYGKSLRIARTESHRNIEAGQNDSAQDISSALSGSGMVYVSIWRSMGDGRVRDAHASMDGKMIEVGDKFKLESGVYTKCPGNSGLARHDCNCRCFLEYDVMTEEEFEQKRRQKA